MAVESGTAGIQLGIQPYYCKYGTCRRRMVAFLVLVGTVASPKTIRLISLFVKIKYAWKTAEVGPRGVSLFDWVFIKSIAVPLSLCEKIVLKLLFQWNKDTILLTRVLGSKLLEWWLHFLYYREFLQLWIRRLIS